MSLIRILFSNPPVVCSIKSRKTGKPLEWGLSKNSNYVISCYFPVASSSFFPITGPFLAEKFVGLMLTTSAHSYPNIQCAFLPTNFKIENGISVFFTEFNIFNQISFPIYFCFLFLSGFEFACMWYFLFVILQWRVAPWKYRSGNG